MHSDNAFDCNNYRIFHRLRQFRLQPLNGRRIFYRPRLVQYTILEVMVGQGRLELPTSRLSSARSNQLSYWPLSEVRGRMAGIGFGYPDA